MESVPKHPRCYPSICPSTSAGAPRKIQVGSPAVAQLLPALAPQQRATLAARAWRGAAVERAAAHYTAIDAQLSHGWGSGELRRLPESDTATRHTDTRGQATEEAARR